MLLKRNQLPDAEIALKKCIKLNPQFGSCYLRLGAVMAKRNRLEEGARYYREFLRLSPDDELAPNVRKLLQDYEKGQQQ